MRILQTRLRGRRAALLAGLGVWAACRGGTTSNDAGAEWDAPPSSAASLPDAALAAGFDRAFSARVRSFELTRSISVRLGPESGSKRLGIVAAYTRVGYRGRARGGGCEAEWIEIEPRGWVCRDFLRESNKRPHGVELPRLERGELVPGVYGKVTEDGATTFRLDGDALVEARELAGSVNVRKHGELVVEDKVYWQIDDGEYLPAESLREHEPSGFHGVRLGDETGLTLPIGFAVNRDNVNHRITTYRKAEGGGVARRLAPRTALPVLEVARGRNAEAIAYRVGEREWVRERDLRYVAEAEPPPHTGPLERWIDVDLYRQVLVAYEGELPVYATLISSGSVKHPTTTGIYRIWVKFAETDMRGGMTDDAPYSVATVPWTQFFAKGEDLALHTAYWHDKFGRRRSHGCINLSPIDSRFLYFWSDPEVPPGWSMAHGVLQRPGSMVRIRSREDPNPEFAGYAAEVHAARSRRER